MTFVKLVTEVTITENQNSRVLLPNWVKMIVLAGLLRGRTQNMKNRELSGIHEFRVRVVGLILGGHVETAIRLLAKYYGVREPRLRVGTVKRHRKVLACYVERERQIYLSNSSFMTDPFVLLHEFYHHIRASGVGKSRQVESRADLFAADFLRDFISWKRATEEKI